MDQIPASQVQYQFEHRHEDQAPTIVAVWSLGVAVAIAAVGMRFQARRIKRLPYLADDWTMLTALVGVDPIIIREHYTNGIKIMFIGLSGEMIWGGRPIRFCKQIQQY